MRTRRWLGIVVIVAGVAGGLVGCGASNGNDAASQSRDATVQHDAASESATSGNGTSFAVEVAEASAADVGRQVVSTATVALRADNMVEAKERAALIVESAGGIVFAEQGQFGNDPSVVLTLKVPPERFRTVLGQLSELGTVDRQDIATEDVTEQVIDLDSRIASAEASVTRVRGFLDRATNVLEISSLESELLRRETDLEKLRGQKRSLDGRIDLATIVLTVQPPVAAATGPASDPAELPGFVEGLTVGWGVLVGAGTLLLAVLGAALPFVPLVGAVAGGLWWMRRRTGPAVEA